MAMNHCTHSDISVGVTRVRGYVDEVMPSSHVIRVINAAHVAERMSGYNNELMKRAEKEALSLQDKRREVVNDEKTRMLFVFIFRVKRTKASHVRHWQWQRMLNQ